jgi:uroporphyrin-III C-methyltransferase
MEELSFSLRGSRDNAFWQHGGPEKGSVWLVGAGPGDPDLLTLRAARALGRADLVLHDHGCEAALALVSPAAQRRCVGKNRADAPVPQAEIIRQMIAGASAGLRVVRLKAGDPLVFGRAAEEIAALTKAGILWRLVPGVSAGTAAPAAAGFPLTARGVASTVTWITAHTGDGGWPAPGTWRALAQLGGTMVVFMGLSRLQAVAARLRVHGLAPQTPVAVIGCATRPTEFVMRTTLAECGAAAAKLKVPTPALVVIGAVAGLGADAELAALADAA